MRSINLQETCDEWSESAGRHAQGRICADVGWEAGEVGGEWAALRGVGDLSREGLAGGSEPAVCFAVEQLVWAGDSAVGRWREDVGGGGVTSSPTTASAGTHQWYDGTAHPWEFKRVWHLEPSLTEAETVYAGIEDAAMFRSEDGGQSWVELSGLRKHGSGPNWQPGAGGMCLHTIVLDPSDAKRMFIAISSAGAFRTDDGGATWKPINRGLRSAHIPDPDAEVGHCVHRIAMHPTRPGVLFMQKHWDVMRSDDAGDNWVEVSGNLPTDFGFCIDVHAHEPETIYVVPIKSDGEHFPLDGKLQVFRSRSGGNEWEALTKGLPQSDCYVNVLRDAMAVDSLDKCGIYFGTTGGQVYCSPDGGDSWKAIVRDLPAVLSVEVQTLPA